MNTIYDLGRRIERDSGGEFWGYASAVTFTCDRCGAHFEAKNVIDEQILRLGGHRLGLAGFRLEQDQAAIVHLMHAHRGTWWRQLKCWWRAFWS